MGENKISVSGMDPLQVVIDRLEEELGKVVILPGGDDLHLDWISAYYHQERAVFKIEGVFHEVLLVAALQWADLQYAYAVWS